MKRYLVWGLGLQVVMLAGCGPKTTEQPTDAPQASNGAGKAAGLQFWHTQTQENEEALKAIIADFNAAHPGSLPIEATYIGSYTDLFEKIRAFASSNNPSDLPDLAVAYESMIAEYMAADIVRPLDDLIADAAHGLAQADLDDFHPAYLETNRFAQFNNQMLSFPFTKSNLMLYYNQDMLDACGLQPPRTWTEFVAACKAIKAKFNIIPLGAAGDPSTFDGMIMSMGGRLISDDQKDALFDTPAALDTIKLLDQLYKEGLAYQVVDKNGQNADFGAKKCAFFIRSSTARPFLQDAIGDTFNWNCTGLPVKDGLEPSTVMFGANICILKSTPEREQQAWEFIKYFTSTATTVRWAMATGYLPVRKSAVDDPQMKAFFEAAPQNRSAFDMLPYAHPEPNAAGWQGVRDCLEEAETTIASQLGKTPEEIAKALNDCADGKLMQ